MRKKRGLWVAAVVTVWLLTTCGKKEEYVAVPESKVSVDFLMSITPRNHVISGLYHPPCANAKQN